MKKRVLSLALAAAMAASLTACSGNSTTTETTAAAEETKAAENANTESKKADGSGVDVSDWKNKTVTCIVPYDAGGGTDTVMRALADAAKGSFKNISVENRSGGGGATGLQRRQGRSSSMSLTTEQQVRSQTFSVSISMR